MVGAGGIEPTTWCEGNALNCFRTANVSPMKRLNRTRTNVIDRRQFHQDLQAIPRERDPLITVWLEFRVLFRHQSVGVPLTP